MYIFCVALFCAMHVCECECVQKIACVYCDCCQEKNKMENISDLIKRSGLMKEIPRIFYKKLLNIVRIISCA